MKSLKNEKEVRIMNRYDRELELELINEINEDKRFFSWSKFYKILALESLIRM